MYIHELDIRDNAVIHLFLNSRLRLSELKNLSIDDLNLDAGRFSIIGKSNKERTGYINEITKKALEEYLRIRDNFHPKNKTLFLRALELYGYNLEYMLNGNDATDEQKQEKISMLKYTYEQILASQAAQGNSKSNNLDNLSSFGKLLSKDFGNTTDNSKLKVI